MLPLLAEGSQYTGVLQSHNILQTSFKLQYVHLLCARCSAKGYEDEKDQAPVLKELRVRSERQSVHIYYT